jgi:hypothetical protein
LRYSAIIRVWPWDSLILLIDSVCCSRSLGPPLDHPNG